MQNTSGSKSPRDGASGLSIVFLWWMNDVLRLGNKRPLTDTDMFPLLENYKAKMLVEMAEKFWFDELKSSQSKNRKPRLWKAMFKLISWKSGLVMTILQLFQSLSSVFLPLCLWLLLKTLNDGPNMDMKFALICAALLGITAMVKATSTQHYDYLTELWGLKLKVALIGLVYKKVLSLNRFSLESTLSGNTVNLISNDAQKIEKFLNQLGMVLAAPLEIVVSLVILWYLIGWEALVGAAFYFFLLAFQFLMARQAAKLREKAVAITDERLVVMNEIISGIRAVKMYAWEWNFKDVVYTLRRKEMAIIRLKGFIVSMAIVLYFTTLPIAALISITTLALTGTYLSSFEIFTAFLGLMTLRHTFCYNLNMSMQVVADGEVALDRVQVFLNNDGSKFETAENSNTQSHLSPRQVIIQDNREVQSTGKKKRTAVQLTKYRKRNDPSYAISQTSISSSAPVPRKTPKVFSGTLHELPLEKCPDQETEELTTSHQLSGSNSKEPHLRICDMSCSWNQDNVTDNLSGITLNASSGDMLVITGAVGSGKSSLLTAIIGELPLNEGAISYQGKVAYVPQIPWIFSGTVRENILFGLPFNKEKFQHVVEVCGLTKDLTDFTNGDLTVIGQRGVTLSGGQKVRVGLARAVYSDADIYLLDDPLSAVDTKVGRKLFDSCILDYLSGRIRLLVTHQLQYLKEVDHIVVMEDGSIICQGGYKKLRENGMFPDIDDFSKPGRTRKACLNEFSATETTMKVINRPRSVTSISLAKEQSLELTSQQGSDVIQSMAGPMPPKRLRSVSLYEFNKEITAKAIRKPSFSVVSFVNINGLEGRDNMAFVDDFELPREDAYSNSGNVKEDLAVQIGSATAPPNRSVIEDDPRPFDDLKEEDESKQTGTVTWRLYWDYFKEGLPVPLVVFMAIALASAQVCLIAPNWWLARMAEMSRDQQQAPDTQVIHACLVAVAIVVMAASSFFFYYLLLKAAENLHNKMAVSTIKAPVLFFDTNPAGRILNRFSKDVGCMDDVLPPLFLQAEICCLFSLCAMLVPASTNYWLFLALLPIIGIFVYYARHYLKSSRELKRIEAIKCSPVYSHLTETANGLEIVHTSNMNSTFLDRLYSYQDENTQAFFMVLSCNRWLGIRLDLLSAAFVTIVAFAAILITENPAFAGLALTYAIQTLNVTQYGVRVASEVENLMTSVERVMTYTEIDSERGYNIETHPPASWPNQGSLTIQDVSLVYFEGGPPILTNINLCVSSKEKVGVVGRTGAGKSSLVSALFRMPEPKGKVLIDGIDIASINLQEARKSMAVITQDPVLFGGTLKRNMDPFSQYTDQELWAALEGVQLKTLVEDLPGQLQFKLRESGTNVSVGERQLVCLARALVQKSKIIIMDEATANVDFKTDSLIQEVIRDKFKDSTVLTIAHRLNTIIDYDKVLVLDGGQVVEFDKPDVLIRNGGRFAEMLKSQNQTVKQ